MRKSVRVSLTALFAALHATLYFISFGLWRNWGIYIESVEGIFLGPQVGFAAALIGSVVARIVKPDDFWMFGIIAEPVSVLMAGFLARTRWKPVLAAFAIMLFAYFIHPYGRALPIWTILDVILAIILIYPAAKICKDLFSTDFKRLPLALVLVSFVCIATDSLVRIFMLVPCGLYTLFFGSFDVLYAVFVEAAVSSYIEDLIVVAVSLVVGAPLIATMLKLKILNKE